MTETERKMLRALRDGSRDIEAILRMMGELFDAVDDLTKAVQHALSVHDDIARIEARIRRLETDARVH